MKSIVEGGSVQIGHMDNNGTIVPVYGTPHKRNIVLATGDRGHYGYPNFPPNTDVGGEFQLYGTLTSCDLVPGGVARFFYGRLPAYTSKFEGNLMVNPPPTPAPVNEIDLSGWGTKAYNRMKPTKPSFQALNAIYELREVPAMLSQRFTKNGLNGIGDYYLALQFGWKPLLQDIRNTVLTHINMQKRLKQLLRDNGRPVRRSIELTNSKDVSTTVVGPSYGGFSPGFVTQFYPKIGTISQTVTKNDRIWSKAEFKYWLPPGPQDVNYKRAMMAKIFGFQPSPAVVWNALPWTWMSDWFFNVGDILENMDAGVANRLAANHFYLMHQQENIGRNDAFGFFYDTAGNVITRSGTSTCTQFRKTRVKGDPFGFFTPENTLSGSQLAIMGALGLSRLR